MGAGELVEHIERCAYAAWPAAEVMACDGWLVRSTAGVTHRANSVWSIDDCDTMPLEEKFATVEHFYADRGRPAIFQMCEVSKPAHLGAALNARGYARGRATTVSIASIAQVLAGTTPGDFTIDLSRDCDDGWLALYRAAEHVSAGDAAQRQEIMRRVADDAAYVIALQAGRPCAVGSVVRRGTWAGVFNMVTSEVFRRKGAARAVMHALATWAAARGATELYLQVMNENVAALTLYERLGFAPLYEYHYRWRTIPGSGVSSSRGRAP